MRRRMGCFGNEILSYSSLRVEEEVVVMVVEVEDVTVMEEVEVVEEEEVKVMEQEEVEEALQMEVGKDSVSTVSLFQVLAALEGDTIGFTGVVPE